MSYYVDSNVRDTERVFSMQNRYDYMRFDMNENPEGLPVEFVESVKKDITAEFLSIYPEPDKFLIKYADFIDVRPENVIATNGSDAAIRYLLQVFCRKGHEVVTVSPSFEMYWVNCSLLGLKHVAVQYKPDLTIDIKDIVESINRTTDVVVLLNPNNPIGNVYTEKEVKLVIEAAKENDAIVIIDEAYHYFYDKTFLDYAINETNVIVLRTFSKLFSIAACRLGVAISNPEIIHYIENIKLSFDVNSIALKFGERILDNPEMIKDLIRTEREGRTYLIEKLEEAGYEVRDCTGNFVFVTPHKSPIEIERELREEKKMLVKVWKSGPLSGFVRVSTGSKNAMAKFLEAFLEIDSSD